jgi:hypothetical protein
MPQPDRGIVMHGQGMLTPTILQLGSDGQLERFDASSFAWGSIMGKPETEWFVLTPTGRMVPIGAHRTEQEALAWCRQQELTAQMIFSPLRMSVLMGDIIAGWKE